MDELPLRPDAQSASDPSPGLGGTPTGPTFQPSPSAPYPDDRGHPSPLRRPDDQPWPDLASLRPPSRRGPALITALVVLVLAVVVLASAVAAHQAERQVAVPASRVVPASPTGSMADSSIEFSTADGSGRLVLRGHSRVSTGVRPPNSGSYLRVQVELICTEGTISYDPYLFQVFDGAGRLYATAEYADSEGQLAEGTLARDEHVRGTLSFDVPRGGTTLLMTDGTSRAVTALKIPE